MEGGDKFLIYFWVLIKSWAKTSPSVTSRALMLEHRDFFKRNSSKFAINLFKAKKSFNPISKQASEIFLIRKLQSHILFPLLLSLPPLSICISDAHVIPTSLFLTTQKNNGENVCFPTWLPLILRSFVYTSNNNLNVSCFPPISQYYVAWKESYSL